MTKLYRKNELGFALLWIGIYVVGTSLADAASRSIGVLKSVTLAAHLAMTVVLLVWIGKNGLMKKYGLCAPEVPAARMLFYLPLAAVASSSLWAGVRGNFSTVETACFVLSMLCVGVLEEVIMRGLLFRALEKNGLTWAIVISSLTFGLGHIVNAVNGSGQSLGETLFQITFAVSVGFVLVLVFLRCGSLVPCILFHGVNNALSAFEVEGALSTRAVMLGNAAVFAVLAAYLVYLVLMKPAPRK